MLPERVSVLALCGVACLSLAATLSTGLAVAAEGGPDSAGYSFVDSFSRGGPVFNFTDISVTGTPVALGDDGVNGPIPIGFPFFFYGRVYTSVYISSNGFLTFLDGSSSGCCTGPVIPSTSLPNGVIAGWWEDFDPPEGGSIAYKTSGVSPTKRFIVQFTNIQHFPSGNPVTYQYKLFQADNSIEVHYLAAPSDGGTHSAGIENQGGTVGLQYYRGTAALTTPCAVRYSVSPRIPAGVLKLLLLVP